MNTRTRAIRLRLIVFVAGLFLVVAGGAGWLVSDAMAQGAAGRTVPISPSVRAEDGPGWDTLTAVQKSALAPLRSQWPTLDASRKSKWLVVAGRFPSMPAAERERVQARMTAWARMSPIERGRARQNFQELRNLHPDDRQALWDAYRALPDEEKRALAQRAKRKPNGIASDNRAGTGKRNIVPAASLAPARPVTPTVVQAKPGATTTLVTKPPAPPAHNQPGLPKIAATEGFVNPSTLLPSRGPQGAAAHPAAASAADPAQ